MYGGLQTLWSTKTSVVTVLLLTAFDAVNVTVYRPDLRPAAAALNINITNKKTTSYKNHQRKSKVPRIWSSLLCEDAAYHCWYQQSYYSHVKAITTDLFTAKDETNYKKTAYHFEKLDCSIRTQPEVDSKLVRECLDHAHHYTCTDGQVKNTVPWQPIYGCQRHENTKAQNLNMEIVSYIVTQQR